MAARVSKPATYEDILALPEGVRGEILAGQLYTQARPASRHARAVSKVAGALDGPFDSGIDGPGGWVLLFEPELHFGGDIVVPDYAGWRRERMPEMPDVPFFELAPDWICEGLSPSTAVVDRSVKLPIYAREKISHVWLVDPILRMLEVLQLENGRYSILAIHEGNTTVRAAPFDAIEIDLSAWWSR